MKYRLITTSLLLTLTLSLATYPGESTAGFFPDGSFIRAEEDEKVYYVEQGKKRWIKSAFSFLIQGFSWSNIRTLPKKEVARIEEGSVLTSQSNVILPEELDLIPDLVPFPARDLRFSKREGRTILKFSSVFWNQGRGPFELVGDPETINTAGDVQRKVSQKIKRTDGTDRLRLVGDFLWHDIHRHYHFNDFAKYIFESAETGTIIPTITEKTSRCLWDTDPVNLNLPGAPQRKVFDSCNNRERQGISVGWGDVYLYSLADQYLDVEDFPSGIYRLSFVVDPDSRFTELKKDNNTSVAFLYIDVPNGIIRTIAQAGPFLHEKNRFPNETLIRTEGESEIYVTYNNRKRWLRNDTLLSLYSAGKNIVFTLPKSVFEAVPFNNLIRADGTTVYTLNDKGYKRHLRTPDIFNSYQLRWEDIADVNDVELAQYPDARLVRVAGDTKIYHINGSTLRHVDSLETFYANGFTWDEVHTINQEDFDTYNVGTEIKAKILP